MPNTHEFRKNSNVADVFVLLESSRLGLRRKTSRETPIVGRMVSRESVCPRPIQHRNGHAQTQQSVSYRIKWIQSERGRRGRHGLGGGINKTHYHYHQIEPTNPRPMKPARKRLVPDCRRAAPLLNNKCPLEYKASSVLNAIKRLEIGNSTVHIPTIQRI